jgi:hypothetical protein
MPKRSSKKPTSQDLNRLAARIVEEVTRAGEKAKDPLAVELGRRGGLKGGKARAAKLSAKRKSEIAKKAALSRWSRKTY